MVNKNKYNNAKFMFKKNFFKHKRTLFEIVLVTLLVNFLTLAISLFSMQVYDRVIPNNGVSTLITLSTGVVFVIIIEFFLKLSRSSLMNHITINLDGVYSRVIYKKLLSIRLDQMPNSIGTMSSKLRSYDTIRSFLTSSTIYLLIDIPFAVLYIFVIALIGTPWISGTITLFFIIAVSVGMWLKYKIDNEAMQNAFYTNKRLGELVESIQSLEVIKANAAQNKFTSRWMRISHASIQNEIDMKHINDVASYVAMFLQNLSYVSIVIVGSMFILDTQMTMGALIACSIIGGRVMSPLASLPGFLVQMAHAKAALKGIEDVYKLESDNHLIDKPLNPTSLSGFYNLADIEYVYNETTSALRIKNLVINKGDKVAIIGSIGSGKSTLLKILSGLYKPTKGKVFVDNLEISQIDINSLTKNIGFMTQDSRLFEGTLKENLLMNNSEITDDILMEVASKTGLDKFVMQHPKGFELPIFEGGVGLSQGQKQVVAVTRLLLNQPNIWLLDEPTASVDAQIEQNIIKLLKENIKEEDTLVMVTHKNTVLPLVNKIIVMNNGEVILYGDSKEVMERLANNRIQG